MSAASFPQIEMVCFQHQNIPQEYFAFLNKGAVFKTET